MCNLLFDFTAAKAPYAWNLCPVYRIVYGNVT